jgi:1-acyl-sn-glycerol-3-phosphate acyltransferase
MAQSTAGAVEHAGSGSKRAFTRLRRVFRASRVGLCFAVFGAGGVLLGWVYLPLATLRMRDRDRAERRSREVLSRSFVFFLDVMRVLRCIDYDARRHRAPERSGPVVFVANHPTLIDVIAVIGSVGGAVCVAKGSLFRNPFTSAVLRRTAFLNGGDGGASSIESVIDQALERLDRGTSVLVFPEGTRSPDRDIHPFGRTAFEIASRAGVPVVPIFLHADPPALKKGVPFHRFPDAFVRYTMEELEPVAVGLGRNAAREAREHVERLIRSRLAAVQRQTTAVLPLHDHGR